MATVQENRLSGGYASGCKAPCRVASTGNLDLNGLETIDTVAVAVGDRVLVKDQTDGSQDGIYVVKAGDWDRAADWNADGDLLSGMLIPVAEGSTSANGLYQVTYSGSFTVGSTEPTLTKIV